MKGWTPELLEKTGLKQDAYRNKIEPSPPKRQQPKRPKVLPVVESYLQQQCVKYANLFNDKILCEGTPAQAKRTDGGYLRMYSEGYITGSSDLKIYSATKFIFVELKREGLGRMSPAQLKYQERCNRLGIEYFVIDNYEKFVELINKKFNLKQEKKWHT